MPTSGHHHILVAVSPANEFWVVGQSGQDCFRRTNRRGSVIRALGTSHLRKQGQNVGDVQSLLQDRLVASSSVKAFARASEVVERETT